MKMKKILFFLLIAVFMIFMIGCDKEEDINEFELLLDTIEGTDGGYLNNMGASNKVLSQINLTDYFIVDMRTAIKFNNEHLAGAVNSNLGGMLNVVEARGNKPVLLVCDSGQNAAYAHVLLNLKGIEAYTLKWGMSQYSEALDVWTGNCSNEYANHANWVTTASASLPSYDPPALNTGEETGEAILDERIDAAIAKGLQFVLGGEVINNTAAYEIYNYFAKLDYDNYGHIKDAYQLTPETLKSGENLYAINPEETNVVYCWTGHTSAAVVAYLTVLGYDVKSLKFGVNSMIYDELTGHKWSN